MHKKLFATFGSLLLATGLAQRVSDAAHQNAPAGHGKPGITVLSFGGTTCPASSAHVNVSDDGEAFTVIFDNFVTQLAPGGSAQGDCTLHLKVNVPKGWQYSIASVDFRGFVSLEPSVTGKLQTMYQIAGQGNPHDHVATHEWAGPFEEDFQVRDDSTGALDFVRCGKGKEMHIDTTVTVSGSSPTASGFLGVDSIDGTIYHLNWRPCS